jgi:hypothetical protein
MGNINSVRLNRENEENRYTYVSGLSSGAGDGLGSCAQDPVARAGRDPLVKSR